MVVEFVIEFVGEIEVELERLVEVVVEVVVGVIEDDELVSLLDPSDPCCSCCCSFEGAELGMDDVVSVMIVDDGIDDCKEDDGREEDGVVLFSDCEVFSDDVVAEEEEETVGVVVVEEEEGDDDDSGEVDFTFSFLSINSIKVIDSPSSILISHSVTFSNEYMALAN